MKGKKMAGEKYQEEARVIAQEELTGGVFSLYLHAGSIAAAAVPGQFVSVYCRDSSRLLPRPISLCEADPADGTLRLVYRVAGKGTEEFSALREGDALRILGPLGNGFPLKRVVGKRVLLIGGGIGIPPLLYAAKKLCEPAGEDSGPSEVNAVLGYRSGQSRKDLFLAQAFAAVMGREPYAATEDGRHGSRGTVLDCMREHALSADVIFACGPTPMLRALKAYALERKTECYLSLEERMACGVGACLACVCHSTGKDAHFNVNRKRVCAEGPVFNAEDVIL